MAGKNRPLCGWRTGAARRADRSRSSAKLLRLFLGGAGTAGAQESCPRGRQALYCATRTLCERTKTDASGKELRAIAEAVAEMEHDSGFNLLVSRCYICLALATVGIQHHGCAIDRSTCDHAGQRESGGCGLQ